MKFSLASAAVLTVASLGSAAQAQTVLTASSWLDRKSTRLNSSHTEQSRMPSSA